MIYALQSQSDTTEHCASDNPATIEIKDAMPQGVFSPLVKLDCVLAKLDWVLPKLDWCANHLAVLAVFINCLKNHSHKLGACSIGFGFTFGL